MVVGRGCLEGLLGNTEGSSKLTDMKVRPGDVVMGNATTKFSCMGVAWSGWRMMEDVRRGELGQVTGELHLSEMRRGCSRKKRENGR